MMVCVRNTYHVITWTAARGERTKQARFRKDVPVHAVFWFVSVAVETCGYMGKEAVRFVNRLGDIAADSQRIPMWALGNAAAVGDSAEGEC